MKIDELRKTYSKLTDAKLHEIFTDSMANLTPEAVAVLIEEVTIRKSPLLNDINKRFRTIEELKFLSVERCNEIRDHACPICGSEEYKLNGIKLNIVTLSETVTQFHIGCYSCLLSKFKEARDKHNLLSHGIWGVRQSHNLLVENEAALKELDEDKPTSSLVEYARLTLIRDYY